MTWHFVVVILTASMATTLFALAGLSFFAPAAPGARPADTDETIFLFEDQRLVDASGPAGGLLDQIRGAGPDWVRLMAYLEPHFPGVEDDLANLPTQRRLRRRAQGDVALTFEADWRGGLIRIVLADPEALGPQPVDRLSLRAQEEELTLLRAAVEQSPILVWRQDRDGTVTWANGAYLTQCSGGRDMSWPLPRLFDTTVAIAPQSGPRRISVPGTEGQGLRWYECQSHPIGTGHLVFALPANPLVHAETTLREFVQTLGKTFAQLPIGLAIFDRSRKLQLFNPALTDLTQIGPEVLTARPSLFVFLDRLRENRMMPERKDYATWRQQMSDLEKAAASGQYEETWNLPTGQTYRVTGRPHPDGAVAFLIEDISAEVSLTRRFRAELELGQQVLDSLTQAVAVFSSAGTLLMSNKAYARLWNMDTAGSLCPPGVHEAIRLWQAGTQPAGIWNEMRRLLLTLGERDVWEGDVSLHDGRRLVCRLTPAAEGATVVVFDERPLGLFPADEATHPEPAGTMPA